MRSSSLTAAAAACALLFIQDPLAADVGGSAQAGGAQSGEGVERSGGPSKKKKVVRSGEEGTNGDVTVENDADSSGKAEITPGESGPNGHSNVATESGFEGTISGVEGNDTVVLGSNNQATICGTGGTVTASGGSTITVNNLGGAGAGDITVQMPSGGSVVVPSGSQGVRIVTG